MPPKQSKCCGCCTSRIVVMAYCTLSAVLYLLSVVTFFPLSRFFPQLSFTFTPGDVVRSANEYCRDYTCNEVCMCGDLPCDFEAQGAMITAGGGLEFACTIMSIVLYTLGGAWAARDYHKQGLEIFAGGVVLFRILFLVSCIILAWAPTEVFEAAFLCADAPRTNPDVKACDGPDGGGLAYGPDGVCTRDWLDAADGHLFFGTIVHGTPRLSPATRRRPARPCHPPRLSACNSRGAGVVYVIGLAIHAHMLFEVYKLRRDIIKGTNVRGV